MTVGMFAFALWDRHTRTLTLARDRVGEKPLYYGWQGDTLLFGSELKALRAHPAFLAGIDRSVLARYFRHGYITAPAFDLSGHLQARTGLIRAVLRAGIRAAFHLDLVPTGRCAKRPSGDSRSPMPAATLRRSSGSNPSCCGP